MERKITNILLHPEVGGGRSKPGGRAPAEAGATAKAGAAATGPAGAARLALLFVLLLTGTAVSSVAGFGASIRGQVRDEAGNALAGVRIRLVHTGKGIVRQTLTDEKGRFLFGNLFFEAHELTAELDGYRPFSRSGLVPKADDEVRLDIVMRPDDGGEGGTGLPGVTRGRGRGGSGPVEARKSRPGGKGNTRFTDMRREGFLWLRGSVYGSTSACCWSWR